MKKSTYKVQLIDTEEKDRVYQKHEKRCLYTRKASIYGCCIKLLMDQDYVKERWDNNFCNPHQLVANKRKEELRNRFSKIT